MKKKNFWGWMLLVALILALVVGGLYVFCLYNHYQQGIAAMDSYNFIAAKRHFEELPFAEDYLADEYAYIQAGVLMEEGQYLESLAAFDNLERLPISVSVLEILGNRIASDEDPYEALLAIGGLKNLSLSSTYVEAMKEKLYPMAQDAYRNYQFAIARKYFDELGDYKRSSDYRFLLEYRLNSTFANDRHYQKLLSLINFEDANVLFIKNNAFVKRFLCGRWEEAKTYKYFEMDKEYDCTYNLPYTYTPGDHYYLSYGEYSVGKTESSAIKQFKISIIDSRTISVYCYKDGSTHTLHRQ